MSHKGTLFPKTKTHTGASRKSGEIPFGKENQFFIFMFLFMAMIVRPFKSGGRLVAHMLDASSKLKPDALEIEFFQQEERKAPLIHRRREGLGAGCAVVSQNSPNAE
jgi:hypothetical protein